MKGGSSVNFIKTMTLGAFTTRFWTSLCQNAHIRWICPTGFFLLCAIGVLKPLAYCQLLCTTHSSQPHNVSFKQRLCAECTWMLSHHSLLHQPSPLLPIKSHDGCQWTLATRWQNKTDSSKWMLFVELPAKLHYRQLKPQKPNWKGTLNVAPPHLLKPKHSWPQLMQCLQKIWWTASKALSCCCLWHPCMTRLAAAVFQTSSRDFGNVWMKNVQPMVTQALI